MVSSRIARLVFFLVCVLVSSACHRLFGPDTNRYAREHYDKREVRIPMRDGTKLFTAIYTPKDASQQHPILLCRTPYGAIPYGTNKFPDVVGPSDFAMRDGFVVVYQDVRGCFLSEGEFENVRPVLERHSGPADVDESTDAWDTIDWLLANVQHHNGKVGMWGMSYPGFFAASGMIDHHPALAAVSPQAPIADWFFDDFHHHGTLFLAHAFNFLAGFGQPRPELTRTRTWGFKFPDIAGSEFFKQLGPLANVDARFFHGKIPFWEDLVAHPNYDAFWEARNLAPRLKNVAPAVLTVGGWFDAEDLYGTLHVYSAVERQNPGIFNALVMGPWQHDGWADTDGDHLGDVGFGAKTSLEFRERIELAFFDRFLKGNRRTDLAEATVFETGANRWRSFDHWPPREVEQRDLYVGDRRGLSFDAPREEGDAASDRFLSDPADPVPYSQSKAPTMTKEFMIEDQRFASRRPDVLAYRSEPLAEDTTIAGPIQAELWVSTSGTDSDWIVKLVDVFPEGYEILVRAEAIRGRFRESYARPLRFVPDAPTFVPLPLQDVLHTFGRGHRIVVQIQCTWFPLVDRNPQKYVDNVFEAQESDFIQATQRVFRSKEHATRLRVGVLPH